MGWQRTGLTPEAISFWINLDPRGAGLLIVFALADKVRVGAMLSGTAAGTLADNLDRFCTEQQYPQLARDWDVGAGNCPIVARFLAAEPRGRLPIGTRALGTDTVDLRAGIDEWFIAFRHPAGADLNLRMKPPLAHILRQYLFAARSHGGTIDLRNVPTGRRPQ